MTSDMMANSVYKETAYLNYELMEHACSYNDALIIDTSHPRWLALSIFLPATVTMEFYVRVHILINCNRGEAILEVCSLMGVK